ncbi:MAG: ribosome biogenesis GTPase Der [Cyclobacteriaceae bacterium]|nr:ribosome biogenesis GTPase Der [Cyclobacteriaceae bacterium]
MANIVAIVGRPNVGKSTLFNRLIERREAIMDDESGVTRDRHYGYAEWIGKGFTVVDTGGYVHGSDDIFEGAIRSQVMTALEEATVILFMTDCRVGLTDLDREFAQVVRKTKKPVLIVANKADSLEKEQNAVEFYELGIGEIYPVSSVSGSGTGDLLDEVVKHFKSEVDGDSESSLPRIAIMGRPNVGKSSFVNVLVGQERSIVTDIAGTTRDSINTRYNLFGKDFLLIDTAGVRKKARVKEDIEFYAVMRSIQALQNSDVSIVMIDAQSGLEAQDINLINLAVKYRKGIVLMVNKWDLIEKDTKTADLFRKELVERLGTLNYIPIVFTSVINKQRVMKAIETAIEVYTDRYRKVPTSELNNVLLKEIEKYNPPAHRGKYIKIKYITQLPTKSPTFGFFCNFPKHIQNPYERFLENKIREHFGFAGVPIKIVFKEK